jgi:hypothetical protein
MTTSPLAAKANLGGALPPNRFVDLRLISSLSWIARLALAITSVSATTRAAIAPALTLEWNINPESDIASYELNYGSSPGSYSSKINVGKSANASISGLIEGSTYYFVVSAYNQSGLKSPSSAEVAYFVPTSSKDDIPQDSWTLAYVDSQESADYPATHAFDGNPNTFWHTQWRTSSMPLPPHDLQIALGSIQSIRGFRYLPRQDAFTVGNIGSYEFYISLDGSNWGDPVATGTFANTQSEKEILFNPKNARYVRLRALSEANGGTECAVAELRVLQATSEILNQAPVASAVSLTTTESTSITFGLTGSDADGDPLTYSVLSGPAHGSLSSAASSLVYKPADGFSGIDSLTFRAHDGTDFSAPAVVSITVSKVDPPLEPKLISRNGWSLKFVDSEESQDYPGAFAFDGSPTTFWHTKWRTANLPPPPHEIQIDLGANRSVNGFRYLPRQDGILIGNISSYQFYVSNDGQDWGPPVAIGKFAATAAEKQVVFTSKAGRYVRLVEISEVNGGSDCSLAELNILEGTATNQAPTATAATLTTEEDANLGMILGGTDPEGDLLTYSLATLPQHGQLVGTAPNLTYTPNDNFSGSDSFTFVTNDGASDSSPATVSITITPTEQVTGNTAPSFANDPILSSATEDESFAGQLIASDPDPGDMLTFSKISGPGWLGISTSGALSGTPLNGNIGTNSFLVRVTDSAKASTTAMLNIHVANTNDAPAFKSGKLTFPGGSERVLYSGQTLAGSATDADAGDAIVYSLVSGPDWLTVSKSGVLRGTPPAGARGTNRFLVRASDREGDSSEAMLEIEIQKNTLPLPWKVDIVGEETLVGGASYHSGRFVVAGGGAAGKTEDAGNFGWQILTSNGSITACIRKLDDTGKATRVGVMIRESLSPKSRQVFMGVDGDAQYRWVRRSRTGANVSVSSQKNPTPDKIWLRLTRDGDLITAFKSSQGTRWDRIGAVQIAMPKNCYMGLSVSSGINDRLNISTFGNVIVNP